jgi:hypothetical protein
MIKMNNDVQDEILIEILVNVPIISNEWIDHFLLLSRPRGALKTSFVPDFDGVQLVDRVFIMNMKDCRS